MKKLVFVIQLIFLYSGLAMADPVISLKTLLHEMTDCIFWLPLRTGTMPPLSGAEGTRVRSLYLPIPDLSDSGDIRDIPKVI